MRFSQDLNLSSLIAGQVLLLTELLKLGIGAEERWYLFIDTVRFRLDLCRYLLCMISAKMLSASNSRLGISNLHALLFSSTSILQILTDTAGIVSLCSLCV